MDFETSAIREQAVAVYGEEDDLEELYGLYDPEKTIASQMKDELIESLHAVDKEYSERGILYRSSQAQSCFSSLNTAKNSLQEGDKG